MGVLTGDPEHHVGIPPDKSADRLFGNVLHLPFALFIDKTTRRPKTFRRICIFFGKNAAPAGRAPTAGAPRGRSRKPYFARRRVSETGGTFTVPFPVFAAPPTENTAS